ncbi:Phosphoribosylamine--glycine ligase [hydrothermal vent metagenome]|uniref:phosphoribosylamine--glycine ligase n=1 Tax=hydrothermal vent metagenome TaxID=652676 RepID=A0A3B0SMA6_9ZZZZ
MNVMLIGGGGREHAMGWKLRQSPRLTNLLSIPGNPGLAQLGAVFPDIDPTDVEAICDLAIANAIDLVVVGPEAPLAAGLIDALDAAGIRAFGPTRDAARLESSKAFSKDIMQRAGIATAKAATFTDADEAAAYLAQATPPYVVKADGLAAGKGVLVTEGLLAAQGWARSCIAGHFGPAGETVVVEEFLDGREVSVFMLCDGVKAIGLEPARDYKRLLDGARGPNTGGMGSYSPAIDLPENLVETTINDVALPVLRVMEQDGIVFKGFLYVGLMLTADGPKVVEFNCRLGDPETQVVLPRLEEDFLTLIDQAIDGNLPTEPLSWSKDACVNVVLAAPGYPESPETGYPVRGLESIEDAIIFHAGTTLTTDGVVTGGGRVVNVVGTGPTVAAARGVAYRAIDKIRFTGKQNRTDIATN